MWRHKATGVTALVLGPVLIIAGLVDHAIIPSKAALCQSPIGQIGQIVDNTVAHDCGLVNALESAIGWLIAVGMLALILGIVILRGSRALPRPAAAPEPWSAAPWSAQPPSPSPAAPPVSWPSHPPSPGPAAPPAPSPPPGPASAPADRPWWNHS